MAKCRAHVTDVIYGLARLARARAVLVLLGIETHKPLVVGFSIAVIDECQPKFEGINLGAWRAILQQIIKCLLETCCIFPLQSTSMPLPSESDACSWLKRRETRPLKIFGQALLQS